MTTARTVMFTVYAIAYALACYAGVVAAEHGQVLYAVALFTTGCGLLLGIHREARTAAQLARATTHNPTRKELR